MPAKTVTLTIRVQDDGQFKTITADAQQLQHAMRGVQTRAQQLNAELINANQQVAYETMVADRYEVDPAYFKEKYGMPVGQPRNAAALPGTGGAQGGGQPFFD